MVLNLNIAFGVWEHLLGKLFIINWTVRGLLMRILIIFKIEMLFHVRRRSSSDRARMSILVEVRVRTHTDIFSLSRGGVFNRCGHIFVWNGWYWFNNLMAVALLITVLVWRFLLNKSMSAFILRRSLMLNLRFLFNTLNYLNYLDWLFSLRFLELLGLYFWRPLFFDSLNIFLRGRVDIMHDNALSNVWFILNLLFFF